MIKQGSLRVICLAVFACIAVLPVHSQQLHRPANLESRILESFNGDDDAPYIWRTRASRFASVRRGDDGQPMQDGDGNAMRYPRTAFVEAWPTQVFGFNRNNEQVLRSFGLNGRFDRRGYNWIDIYPTLADDPDGRPFEIPIPGRVVNIDCWVWGANLRFFIEIYLRDYRGVVHALRLGDLNFTGWQNLNVNIPSSIPQGRRSPPFHAGLHFVKFRIWTRPVERVDNFFIYFNQLKILTDTFEALFDGNDLADPRNVERLWADN